MKILYLTELPCWHVENDLILLHNMGCDVTLVNTHPSKNGAINTDLSPGLKITHLYNGINWEILQRGFPFNKLYLSQLPSIKKKLNQLLNNVDLVYSSWSTGVIPEIYTVKSCNTILPIVWRVLMYPAATNSLLEFFENKYCTHAVHHMDGFIFSSPELHAHFQDTFSQLIGKYIIFPEYISRQYFPTKKLPLLNKKDGEPHIIFIGNITNYQRYAHNDIRQLVYDITKTGIHVHLEKNNDLLHSNYIHQSSRIPWGKKLGEFITQFDACLVAYNLSHVRSRRRFDNVIPNRLISALLGSIPIALFKGSSLSSERFIREQGIGFVFQTPHDLKHKLMNRLEMDTIRTRCSRITEELQLEFHMSKIADFLENVVKQHNSERC